MRELRFFIFSVNGINALAFLSTPSGGKTILQGGLI